jgi:hypothetical protein
MSNKFKIKLDGRELKKELKKSSKLTEGVAKATTRSLNRTGKGIRTDAKRQITSTYHIKGKDVQDELKLQDASFSDQSVTLKPKIKARRLIKFRTKPNKKPGIKGSHTAFANVKKGSTGGRISGAFMATTKNGTQGIFVRETSNNLPIKQLHGPSVATMFNNKNTREFIRENAVERFNKAFDHEMSRLLK